ncbi:DnaJ-related protein rsp1 [Lasiodiplodia hormozganensis]|uniref:DnaJ-related protein rsp1 n=1 Tax=Lasiodiplodia hormozganensis TaxID=869390 RepID=A0AA40D6P8_9PEZI|nr:DnaJ-related protein rsp1 [Lasiodiplodia hormozganensis]
MVKADPKRNYYADLEVAPDADAEEIRKQFRKLALKWHPDRNPGREAECVPKFQAIQAANEILGDPAERTRYDLERRKRGGGPSLYTQRQPAPRGNPYQAQSNFPPPPRRTGPQRPGATNSSASSGANRFSSFPKPPPTQRKDADHQKANVFNAWQNMKPKTSTHTSQAESSHQRAKSAWEHTQESYKPGVSRSQSTRMPKRGGFDPTTPGADEPPAASTSSYFTTSNYGRPVPPPPPPPRDPGTAQPQQPSVDPLKQFKDQFQQEAAYPEGMRTRTPYGSAGGEKIFVDPVRRSASQRSSPQRGPGSAHASAGGASATRHHSSSPPRRKGNATRPFAMYSSSEEDEPVKPPPKTSQQHRTGSMDANYRPQSNGFNANETNGGMGQKSKSSIFSFPIDTDTFVQTNGEQAKSDSTENINTKFSPQDWHGKFEGKPDYFAHPVPPNGSRAKKSPTRPPSSRTNSMQNFASTAAAQMPQPTPPQAESSAGAPPPAAQTPGGEPGPVRFSPDQWAKTFKDPSFVLPTEPPKAASPVKGPAPMRGRKQSRTRPAGANVKPKSASVADTDDNSEGAESTNDTAATDSSAMDIDPTPPAPQTNGAQRPKIVPTPISQARAAQKEQAQAKPQEADDSLRFKEFANVAPFTATSQEGLKNLNDLTQNLPFDSRPAASHPTQPAEPTALQLPQLPKAPEVPKQLTMSVWREQLPKMAAYVKAFQQWDSHMLQHFAARQHETDAMGAPVNWLGAAGDLTATGGFGSYMRGIKEDERAREHWMVGWEKHRDAMELFEGMRARVMKGGLAA